MLKYLTSSFLKQGLAFSHEWLLYRDYDNTVTLPKKAQLGAHLHRNQSHQDSVGVHPTCCCSCYMVISWPRPVLSARSREAYVGSSTYLGSSELCQISRSDAAPLEWVWLLPAPVWDPMPLEIWVHPLLPAREGDVFFPLLFFALVSLSQLRMDLCMTSTCISFITESERLLTVLQLNTEAKGALFPRETGREYQHVLH